MPSRPVLLLALVAAHVAAQAQLPQWRLVEETRSGLKSPGGALEGPGAIAVAPTGMVFVAQRGVSAVQVYRPDGSFERTIGRAGSGPGEFRSLDALGILGDSLFVADANLQRLTFFSHDGKLLTSARVYLPPRDPFGGALPETVLRDGTLVGVPMVNMHASLALRQPLLRFTRDGIVRDTLRWITLEHHVGVLRVGTSGVMNFAQPFSDEPIRAAASNGTGVVVVDRPAATRAGASSFTVTWFGARGQRLYSRTVAYTPRRLSERAVDSAVTAMTSRFTSPSKGGAESRRVPPIDVGGFKTALYRPEYYPPVSVVIAADDGSAWIQVTDASSAGTFRILDQSGTPTATVGVPKGFTVKHATATHVWAFGTDDDVPFLARYRIVKQ